MVSPVSGFNPAATAHFGGVYKLVSNEYGFTTPIMPDKESDQAVVTTFRTAQYLHPGTDPGHHETTWERIPTHSGILLVDGPDLTQWQAQSKELRSLQHNPELSALERQQAQLAQHQQAVALQQKAVPLDVTNILQYGPAFPMEATTSGQPAPAGTTTGNNPLQEANAPMSDNPLASLAPQAGLDPNAAAVWMTNPQIPQYMAPLSSEGTAPQAQAPVTTPPAPQGVAAPGPMPMAYTLQPPGPLNPAALEATISNTPSQ